MRYDTYCIFYIPENFTFNLPHYVTSYMHHTGKKESKKEIKKRRRKKKGYEKLLQGDWKQDLETQLELIRNASIHWTTSVNVENIGLKEVHIPSLC